jgi:hypothetical protein
LLGGCSEDGPAEEAGEQVDEAADEAEDAAEEAGDEAEDATDYIGGAAIGSDRLTARRSAPDGPQPCTERRSVR